MPKFDAGALVEALDWDFTKAGVKAKGVTPEPSDQLIGDFLDGIKKLYAEARHLIAADLPDNATAEQMLDAMSDVSGADFVDMMARTAGLFADLCSGSPSQENLLDLPLRVRVGFYSYMQSEVVNPEARTGAGNRQVVRLPSAAAG